MEADTYTIDDYGNEEIDVENISLYVLLHIGGSADGKPGLKLENGQRLPWHRETYTPHHELILVPRDAVTYTVSIGATYPSPDYITLPKTVFRCEIWDDGVPVVSEHVVVRGPTTTIECNWRR